MTTLTVGVGEEFQTIAAAVAASQDGDIVQVQAGTYINDFAEISTKITLEGVGGMVNLVATQQIPNGKAILITDTDVTIDHFSFSGATVADQNGAGIRYQGGNLTLTNDAFYNNQDGLLSASDPSGSINIQNSDFYDNGVGGDGHTHNIYVGDIGQLTINNSLFYGANVGHEIKSRAENTTITNTRIQDESGATASYEIDLPNGGNAIITNDTIEKSATSQNPTLISYGEEGGVYASSSLVVSNDTIINDQSYSSNIGIKNTTSVTATISNDRVFGLTSGQLLSGPGTVSGISYLTVEPTLITASAIQSGTPTPTPTTPTPTPTTPTATTGLVLDISEDAYLGNALYTISVDGHQIGGTMTATASHAAGQTQPIVVNTTLSTGTHTVTVNFLNDAYGGLASLDRNLYLDTAQLNGQTISGSSLTLAGQGPQSFGVTVPSTGLTTPTPTPTPAATTTNTLMVDISEDAYQGNALYTIKLDGVQVGGTLTASASHVAGQTQAITVSTALTSGSHTIGVTFLNDAYGGLASLDRNLYVDGATLNGQTIAGSTLTLDGQGTQSFGVTVPNAGATPTPTPTSALLLNISEDAYQGNALYTVAIDGTQQGGTMTATASHAAGQSQAVAFNPVLAAGAHTVAIAFLNDAYGGSASLDRNLYLNSATLNGTAIPGSTITMDGQGTYSFSVTVPSS